MRILYRSFQTYKNGKNLSPAEKSLETLKEVFQASFQSFRKRNFQEKDITWKYRSGQRNKKQ